MAEQRLKGVSLRHGGVVGALEVRASDLFEVVVRIAGFFLVLIGTLRLLFMIPYIIKPFHGLDGPDPYSEAAVMVVMASLGFALLFGGRAIARVVYPTHT